MTQWINNYFKSFWEWKTTPMSPVHVLGERKPPGGYRGNGCSVIPPSTPCASFRNGDWICPLTCLV